MLALRSSLESVRFAFSTSPFLVGAVPFSHAAESLTGTQSGVAIISYYNESASGPPLELLLQVVFVVCWAAPTTTQPSLPVSSCVDFSAVVYRSECVLDRTLQARLSLV